MGPYSSKLFFGKSSSSKSITSVEDINNKKTINESDIPNFTTRIFKYSLKGNTCEQSKYVNKNTVEFCRFSNKQWMKDALPKSFEKYSNNDYKTLSTTIDENTYNHSGFIQHLAIAWASEFGIMIRPDMFHHLICCEISRQIIKKPELFRHLYTNSPDKESIVVVAQPTDHEVLLKLFDARLSLAVPNKLFKGLFTDVTFKSQPANYEFVKRVSFCKSATPFYDFGCTSCGFPSISIVDDIEDWTKLYTFIEQLISIIPLDNCYDEKYSYMFTDEEKLSKFKEGILSIQLGKMKTHIHDILLFLINKQNNKLKEKLQKIFYINDNKQCMSGHNLDYYVKGWIRDFYVVQDHHTRFDLLTDFPVHLPYVPFNNNYDNSKHVIITGLTNSTIVDNIMTSEYGKIHHEIINNELFAEIQN